MNAELTWDERNEIFKQKQREWYQAHKEERRAYMATYRAEHREQCRAYRRRFYQRHREEILAQQREERKRGKEARRDERPDPDR